LPLQQSAFELHSVWVGKQAHCPASQLRLQQSLEPEQLPPTVLQHVP
jgi:hypothetical protein